MISYSATHGKQAATAYSVAHTNKWVDDMLKQGMDELKKSVGPVVLPAQSVEFEVKVLWEDVKGGLDLTDGKLENVFNIHRLEKGQLASGKGNHRLPFGLQALKLWQKCFPTSKGEPFSRPH